MKRIPSRKRHFQLLELMVAIFILLVCIVPTMRIFTSMYQAQREIIRENQRDHLAHMVHAKFTEKLYKRQITLEEILHSQTLELADPELNELLQKSAYACHGTFTVIKSSTPKGSEKPNKYLGQLIVKMKDCAFKPQAKTEAKKIENQDPSESFYDYFVYIDAQEKNKKEDQAAPSQEASSSKKPAGKPASPTEAEEDDE